MRAGEREWEGSPHGRSVGLSAWMISGPHSDSLSWSSPPPAPTAQKPKGGIDTPQTTSRKVVWVCTFSSFFPILHKSSLS